MSCSSSTLYLHTYPSNPREHIYQSPTGNLVYPYHPAIPAHQEKRPISQIASTPRHAIHFEIHDQAEHFLHLCLRRRLILRHPVDDNLVADGGDWVGFSKLLTRLSSSLGFGWAGCGLCCHQLWLWISRTRYLPLSAPHTQTPAPHPPPQTDKT